MTRALLIPVIMILCITRQQHMTRSLPKRPSSRVAKSLELDTPYIRPPGDPLERYTAALPRLCARPCSLLDLIPSSQLKMSDILRARTPGVQRSANQLSIVPTKRFTSLFRLE
jgi:hypothetical protein